MLQSRPLPPIIQLVLILLKEKVSYSSPPSPLLKTRPSSLLRTCLYPLRVVLTRLQLEALDIRLITKSRQLWLPWHVFGPLLQLNFELWLITIVGQRSMSLSVARPLCLDERKRILLPLPRCTLIRSLVRPLTHLEKATLLAPGCYALPRRVGGTLPLLVLFGTLLLLLYCY